MATRRDNMKELMRNSRTRTVIVFTGIMITIVVVIGLFSMRAQFSKSGASAVVGGTGAAGVVSIPGALNPSDEYAKLIETQNLEKAKAAKKTGASAIPTLVRSELFGQGKSLKELEGQRGLGFAALARNEENGGGSKTLWIDNLRKTGCSAAALKEARDNGVSVEQMHEAGCTAEQLLAAGYNLAALIAAGYTAEELRAAGFSAEQLRAAGMSLADLRKAGFSACDVKAAGFSPEEMKAAGYTDGELRGAGIDPSKIISINPYGSYSEDQVKAMGCTPDSVTKALAAGVTVKAMREVAGCSAKELHTAGLTAAELKAAGFTPAQVRAAGYTAEEMRVAGYKDDDLKAAGFSPSEIAASKGYGNYTEGQIQTMGCSEDAIKKAHAAGVGAQAIRSVAGCSLKQILAAGYSPAELKKAGFTAAQLQAAGVKDSELLAAGYTPQQVAAASTARGNAYKTAAEMRAAGFTPEQIRAAGFTAAEMRAAGFTPAQLRAAGFTAEELRAAGFNDADLKAAGFRPEEILASKGYGSMTPDKIKSMGCSPEAIKKAHTAGVGAQAINSLTGCTLKQIHDAGYSAAELKKAGFTAAQLLAAGLSKEELAAAGYTTAQIAQATKPRNTGSYLTAAEMRAAGASPEEMKAAGFTAEEMRAAGLSEEELKAAGFTPEQIAASRGYGRYTPDQIRSMGCSVAAIKTAHGAGVGPQAIRNLAGCSLKQIKEGGYSAAEMRKGGFTAEQLKAAGYTDGELAAAGFSPAQIAAANTLRGLGSYTEDQVRKMGCTPAAIQKAIDAGVNPAAIADIAGCSLRELRAAGVTAAMLRPAGFSAAQLHAAGFSAAELAAAGYTPEELLAAGIAPAELRAAGISAAQLAAAGVTPAQLKNAGYSVEELKAANINPSDIAKAGYTLQELKSGGFSDADIAAANPTLARLGGLSALGGGALTDSNLTPAQQQQKRLDKILADQAKQVSAQHIRQDTQIRTTAMLSRANSYFGAWDGTPSQSYNKGDERKTPEPSNQGSGGRNGTVNSGVKGAEEEGPKATVILPGDIMFGVIETSINSDEPGPVLATVVSGKFKGARLVGTIALPDKGEKVIITFNTMTMVGIDQAISVNAVAIDPFTARTALATHTNKHTLARWGGLFASSFIQGMGEALQQSNSTTTQTITPAGIQVTTAAPNRTNADAAKIALARVGERFSGVLGQQFSRKPTVTVRSGVSVGLLFTAQATVPVSQITETQKNRAFLGAMFG